MAGAACREDLDAGVGVLGWFGFIVVNLAALGIIGISSSLGSWGLPFCFCLAYTVILIFAAVLLERRGGAKQAPFINLLWVLGCGFVLVSGSYLAVNAFDGGGSAPEDDDPGVPYFEPSGSPYNLSVYLPPGSSSELKDWADGAPLPRRPNLNNFQGFVFFPSLAGGSTSSDEDHKVLWYSDGKRNEEVAPIMYEPCNLLILRDRLFFSAHLDEWGDCSKLFSISSVGENATLVSDLLGGGNSSSSTGNLSFCIESMRVDADEQMLYIKVSVEERVWQDRLLPYGLYRSDGTKRGTQRLDDAASGVEEETTTAVEESEEEEENNRPQLCGVLLFGDLPMLGLGVWVLVEKKLPGVALNIFGGVWVAAVLLFAIVTGSTAEPPMQFVKWFSAIYAGLGYVGIVFVHVKDKDTELKPWLQELESWLLVPVSITFFCAVHWVLKLDDGWWWFMESLLVPLGHCGWWFLYFLIIILEVVASLVLHRTLPMVLAAVGLLEVAWKISSEVVSLLFGDPDSDAALLTMLFLLALQGCGIIAVAVMYTSRKERIESRVRELVRGSGSKLLPAEREGDENFE